MPEIRYEAHPDLIFLNFIFSEYTDRYVPHRPEAYLSSKRPGIPRIYSTAVDRSVSDCSRRPIKMPDAMEIDFACSPRRNTNVPRAYFYLGSMERRTGKQLPYLTESTNIISVE